MHRRKKYLIYPPNYTPGDGYQKRYSVFQAKKCCMKMGLGAEIDVSVHMHPSPFTGWNEAFNQPEKAYVYGDENDT